MRAILDTFGNAILDNDGKAILDTSVLPDYPGHPIDDESYQPILDEYGQPIEDEYPLQPPVEPERRVGWVIYVLDEAYNRVAQVDTFTAATIIPRFNTVGSYQLAAENTHAARLATTDEYGLEFVRDGVTVMSGPVTKRTRMFDATQDGFLFEGVDDTVWLARRLVYPDSAPYTTVAHDVRTGPATSVLVGFVSANAGPLAPVERQVLTIGADTASGGDVTGRGRWQVLLDLCGEIAAAGGVGFRVRKKVFEPYVPVDRSQSVVFSIELGNLGSFTHTEHAPDVNHVVVGGSGELTARVIREVQDAGSIGRWGRVEAFRDRRDTAVVGELDQSGQESLTEGASKVGFSIEPLETDSTRYLADYDLGDLVTVVVDGVAVVDVIREVVITLTDEGETVKPTVGDPDVSPDRPSIFQKVNQALRRLRNVERI